MVCMLNNMLRQFQDMTDTALPDSSEIQCILLMTLGFCSVEP